MTNGMLFCRGPLADARGSEPLLIPQQEPSRDRDSPCEKPVLPPLPVVAVSPDFSKTGSGQSHLTDALARGRQNRHRRSQHFTGPRSPSGSLDVT